MPAVFALVPMKRVTVRAFELQDVASIAAGTRRCRADVQSRCAKTGSRHGFLQESHGEEPARIASGSEQQGHCTTATMPHEGIQLRARVGTVMRGPQRVEAIRRPSISE